MKKQLEEIKQRALVEISNAEDSSSLNDVRVRYLGKNGEMTTIMRGLGSVSKEDRPIIGKLINDVKVEIESNLDSKTKIFSRR